MSELKSAGLDLVRQLRDEVDLTAVLELLTAALRHVRAAEIAAAEARSTWEGAGWCEDLSMVRHNINQAALSAERFQQHTAACLRTCEVIRDEKITRIAEACHEANRIYCESIGDTSQPKWDDAPEWQRTSAINGVEGALAGNTPEESHLSWLAEKHRTGWTYGEVKDPDAKTHPCMVDYDELPREQQQKDAIFVATVHRYAHEFGLTIQAPPPAKTGRES